MESLQLELEKEKKSVLEMMSDMEHEQVVFCHDKHTGLKAIIAIHNTVLGPALGGTRMWNYQNESEALNDVLRLSRGMSYKAAISGLNLGGGKAVIIGDSYTGKSEALFRRFGRFVDSLGGKYITAEDVGISPQDMEYVHMETNHVSGLPISMGGSGDPSPVTAYGVYVGMKACSNYTWGNDSLAGKKVLVQGIGHVGEFLVGHLVKEGAKVIVTDINEARMKAVVEKYNVDAVIGDEVYDLDMDIYAPCALGATVNSNTIDRLKCKIIAGAANNQLENEELHGMMVKDRGIVYAPDFLINAGGLISVNSEVYKLSAERSMEMTEKIYDGVLNILNLSEEKNIPTSQAALELAKSRIDIVSKVKSGR
ncbi:MAG TPA: leucine dehydrogenase [Flavobacteriales bacterium]|nr:leucine dehydrogenase [Flavobacteriales bacterium]